MSGLDEQKSVKGNVSRAEKMFPDFAAILQKAREDQEKRLLERAARSEQQVRSDITAYVQKMVGACLETEGKESYEAMSNTLGVRFCWAGDRELIGVSVDGSGEHDSIYYIAREENGVHQVFRRDDNSGEFVEVADEFIRESSVQLLRHHHVFLQTRTRQLQHRAAELSNGDKLLGRVMEAHLAYSNGRPSSPSSVDGIDFYVVGRNASHEFYLGTKDGRMFKRAFGESGRKIYETTDPYYRTKEQLHELGLITEEDLEDPERASYLLEEYNSEMLYEDHVYEVDPDNIGYVGHF